MEDMQRNKGQFSTFTDTVQGKVAKFHTLSSITVYNYIQNYILSSQQL